MLAEKLERIHQYRSRRMERYRACQILLAELALLRVDRDGKVCVLGSRESEGALNQNLARGRFEEVATSHHLADSLFGVVHHRGKVVGDDAVRAQHHEIAHLGLQALGGGSLNRIPKPDVRGADAHSNRASGTSARKAVTAGAGIDASRQVSSRATAIECPTPIRETFQRFGVRVRTPTLVHDFAVPVHCTSLEIAQD